MRPDEFVAQQMEQGWQVLAVQAFGLYPSEVAALRQLMLARGRVVTLEGIAEAFTARGWGAGSRGRVNGSAKGIRKRIERLRAKLDDVGCAGVIKTELDGAYSMPVRAAMRVEAALRAAFGVNAEARAA